MIPETPLSISELLTRMWPTLSTTAAMLGSVALWLSENITPFAALGALVMTCVVAAYNIKKIRQEIEQKTKDHERNQDHNGPRPTS